MGGQNINVPSSTRPAIFRKGRHCKIGVEEEHVLDVTGRESERERGEGGMTAAGYEVMREHIRRRRQTQTLARIYL